MTNLYFSAPQLVRHRAGHRPTTGRAAFSKAADWSQGERSAPASGKVLRLIFGKPGLAPVRAGVEQFAVRSHSGEGQ